MHSIKHQARNIAWRYGDNESVNYNPFAMRSRSYIRNRSPHDEESGLRKTNTTDNVQTAERQARYPEMHGIDHEDHIHYSSSEPTKSTPFDAKAGGNPSDLPGIKEDKETEREVIRSNSQNTGQTGPLGRSIPDSLLSRKTIEGSLPRKELMGNIAESACAEVDPDMDSSESQREQKRRFPAPNLVQTLKCIILESWMYLLFAFVPAGFAVKYAHTNAATVFAVNFIAIVPSATMLSFARDELALHVGDKLGALLNMTSSNAVQLITSVLLLKSRQIQILRVSLIGTILNNLLLTTGLGFLMGGLRFSEQKFNAAIAQTISMLLLLATISLTIPTTSQLMASVSAQGIVMQSRGTSVVVLVSYALWMVFQLKTHRNLFDNVNESERSKSSDVRAGEKGATLRALSMVAGQSAASAGGYINQNMLVYEGEEEEDIPRISAVAAITTMLVSITLLAFNSLFATDSIQGLLEEAGLTDSFIGIVILPLLGIDPTSIKCAIIDKVDLSIALTLERCMQTSLLVVPIIVLLAWCMGIDDMTLEFNGFIVAALFASIIIVTYVVQEGRSNWLTGALLIKVFIIISLAAFFIE